MKKVIFHAHELDDWSKVIASASNALADLVNVDIVILGNGPALAAQELTQEQAEAIHFTYVPSGVVELIARQEDGYAYIRA